MIKDSNNNQSPARLPCRITSLWKKDKNGIVSILSDAEFNLSFLVLNKAGSLIWELCDGGTAIGEILEIIQEHYRLDEQDTTHILNDLHKFLNDLEIRKLIKL